MKQENDDGIGLIPELIKTEIKEETYEALLKSEFFVCPRPNCKMQFITEEPFIEHVQRHHLSSSRGRNQSVLENDNLEDIPDDETRRRERYIIIHMWKILHQRCPNDLGIHFSTPSRHGIKATIPSFSKSSTQQQQSLYDGSFAVMGPRLWNTIPSDLHLIEDPLLFKAKLSEFLKPFPDNPSVSNYSCPNGNSLLDWSMNKAAAMLQGRSTIR